MRTRKFWTERRLKLLYRLSRNTTYHRTAARLLGYFDIISKDQESIWSLFPSPDNWNTRLTYSDTEYNDMNAIYDEMLCLETRYSQSITYHANSRILGEMLDSIYDTLTVYKERWEHKNYDPSQLPSSVLVADTMAVVGEIMQPTGPKDNYYDKLAKWAAAQ